MPLAESRSSNAGDHWNGDHCPYDDGPVKVFAPQHTHPHSAFSPDGSRVVFTSDKSGVAQLYEVTLFTALGVDYARVGSLCSLVFALGIVAMKMEPAATVREDG